MSAKAFPRGGAGVLTPLEIRSATLEAERDVAAQTPKRKKPKKRTLSQSNDDDSRAATKQPKRSLETLSFKKLSKGMILLGAVKEVREYDATISLPHGLSGFVHATDISQPFTSKLKDKSSREENEDEEDEEDEESDVLSLADILRVGLLVRCCVLELKLSPSSHHRIRLTLDPVHVNRRLVGKGSLLRPGLVLSGCVESVEDHGYIVSFGTSERNGFLSTACASEYVERFNQSKSLGVGQIINCVILPYKASELKTVPVTINSKELNKITHIDGMISFEMVTAGMLVKGTVTQVSPDGLLVEFLDGFTGSVGYLHLRDQCINADEYHANQKIKGRILYVNTTTKMMGLSLQKNLCANEAHAFGEISIGAILKAKIEKVDPHLGLVCQVDSNQRGFVHIGRISDSHIDKIQGKKYKVGTVHDSRVLGFNTLDGVVTLSMQRSVLELPFILYDDIKIGSIVTGTVLSVESFGVRVSISEHIRGLIPSMHLADVHLKHPERKFKEGKKIECRVLEVKPRCHKLLLTHKKTLVKSSLPPLCNKEDAFEGAFYHGVIVSVRHYGCIVAFYGDVKGLIHKTELSFHVIDDPVSCFRVGQVVQCRVISTSHGKLRFSLRELSKSTSDSSKEISDETPIGTLVQVCPSGVSDKGLTVDILPHKTTAFIPMHHLSDHLDHCHHLLTAYSKFLSDGKEQRLDGIIICQDQTYLKTVSLKPSLLTENAIDQAKLDFDDLEVGTVMLGWIHQIMPYGAFLRFSSGLVGLAPIKYLADKFVTSSNDVCRLGQSFYCKVVEVDKVKRRFLLSLRLSDLQEGKLNRKFLSGVDLLQSFLSEKRVINKHLLQQEKSIVSSLLSLAAGSVLEGKVGEKSNLGLFLKVRGHPFKTFVPPGHYNDGMKRGESVFGVVLDYDVMKNLVYVSLKEDLVESREVQYKQELAASEFVEVRVELVNPDYLVVSLPRMNHLLAVAPTRLHLNASARKQYAVGQTVGAEVACPVNDSEEADVTRLSIVLLDDRTMSKSKPNLPIGTLVRAVIKSVHQLQLNVSLGDRWHGRVHATELSDNLLTESKPLESFKEGQEVEGVVIGFRQSRTNQSLAITQKNLQHTVAEVSLRQSLIALARRNAVAEIELLVAKDYVETAKKGDTVTGIVSQVQKSHLLVLLTPSVKGKVHCLDCSLDPEVVASPTSHFSIGQALSLEVLNVNRTQEFVELSETGSVSCQPGRVTVCRFGKEVTGKGICVQLPCRNVGFLALTDICDEYPENPFEQILEGSLARCYLLSVDDRGHFDVSLRKSRVDPSEKSLVVDREICSTLEIEVGNIVRGYVSTVAEKAGVFIRIGRNLTGRVKITNLFDGFVKKWTEKFHLGQLVTAKVLSIDESTGHVEVSLKMSHVNPTEAAKRSSGSKEESLAKRHKTEEDEEGSSILENYSSEGESEGEEEEEENQASLKLSDPFNWKIPSKSSEEENADVNATPASESTNATTRKATKRQVRAERIADERNVFMKEHALMDDTLTPQSADDFDRRLASNPSSSVLWLQYMAHYTHVAEFDKARAVAQRALKMIPFHEEAEKLNIWTGLMNLENLYGTEETLLQVFESALKHNDPLAVFIKLVNIYVDSNKFDWAEKLYQTMLKRFSTNQDVWVRFGIFYMQRGKAEAARSLLQRCLKVLPRNEHVDVISKFGRMEFEHGDAERGRDIFDGILKSYPKRVDMWNAYIELMIKQENWVSARGLFEQALCLKFSRKTKKIFTKRFLEFEDKYGDENTRDKARETVATV